MTWADAILGVLAVVELGFLVVLTVWAHRILLGVNALVVYLDQLPPMEEDDAEEHGIVAPDQVPMSKHLHDVIATSPVTDASVGEFQGRQPWVPPLPPDDANA